MSILRRWGESHRCNLPPAPPESPSTADPAAPWTQGPDNPADDDTAAEDERTIVAPSPGFERLARIMGWGA